MGIVRNNPVRIPQQISQQGSLCHIGPSESEIEHAVVDRCVMRGVEAHLHALARVFITVVRLPRTWLISKCVLRSAPSVMRELVKYCTAHVG
jgi:hypothetical protein